VALTRYCEDGDLEIDNNAAERSLRGIAVGRNNRTFFGSDNGGETAAVLKTFVALFKLPDNPLNCRTATQKMYFKANWTIRGSPADSPCVPLMSLVIWPKFPLFRVATGMLGLRWFRRLNA